MTKRKNYTGTGSIATTRAEVARRLRVGQVPVYDAEGEPTGRTAYSDDYRSRWPWRPQDQNDPAARKIRNATEQGK